MSKLKILFLHSGAQAPKRQTEGSAGYDLYACLDTPVTIAPGAAEKIPLGIAIQLESSGYAGFIFARSSLGTKYGIVPANGVGVIDSDYRGEVCVCLRNHGAETFTVNHGDRIAQLLVMPVSTPEIEICTELDQTQRGTGGFGSTGK